MSTSQGAFSKIFDSFINNDPVDEQIGEVPVSFLVTGFEYYLEIFSQKYCFQVESSAVKDSRGIIRWTAKNMDTDKVMEVSCIPNCNSYWPHLTLK